MLVGLVLKEANGLFVWQFCIWQTLWEGVPRLKRWGIKYVKWPNFYPTYLVAGSFHEVVLPSQKRWWTSVEWLWLLKV
jgi:hypothetical protein